MSEIKSISIGDQVFDLHWDFFICPLHGIFVPSRFDPEWNTERGCPVAVGAIQQCEEKLTPIYLDTVANFNQHRAEATLARLLEDKAVEAAAAQDPEWRELARAANDPRRLSTTRRACADRMETIRSRTRRILGAAIQQAGEGKGADDAAA